MASKMRDMFDHDRPVTCTVCNAKLHWAEDQDAWVDFYGIDVCRDENGDYWAHDANQEIEPI